MSKINRAVFTALIIVGDNGNLPLIQSIIGDNGKIHFFDNPLDSCVMIRLSDIHVVMLGRKRYQPYILAHKNAQGMQN